MAATDTLTDKTIRAAVVKHRAAVTDPSKLGELLRAIDRYQGTPVVRAALVPRR